MRSRPQAPALFVITPILRREKNLLRHALQDSFQDSAPLGVYSLLGRLDKMGYKCDLLDWIADSNLSLQDVVEIASEYHVVFFSANSMNWATALLIAREVRKISSHVKFCIGGPHPTLYPEYVQKSKAFDFLFRGEADRHIHLIYENLLNHTCHRIEGFSSCVDGDGKKTEIIQIMNLQELESSIAYDRMPKDKYRVVSVETSRGCKNNCAFCSIPAKKNWRAYPADKVVEHLSAALEYCGIVKSGKISIVDDCFTFDHQRVFDICRLLPLKKFHQRLNYHASLIDFNDIDLIEALAPFTSGLLIGAEVCTRADAKKISKPTDPKLIQNVAANLVKFNLNKRGLFTFIMGFPWHSIKDCMHTLSFVTNLILDYGVRVVLQWYWAMPGSAIWNVLEKEQRVDISVVDHLGFYHSPDWFYNIRSIKASDIDLLDKNIRPVQICLALHQANDNLYPPLLYSPPALEPNYSAP